MFGAQGLLDISWGCPEMGAFLACFWTNLWATPKYLCASSSHKAVLRGTRCCLKISSQAGPGRLAPAPEM